MTKNTNIKSKSKDKVINLTSRTFLKESFTDRSTITNISRKTKAKKINKKIGLSYFRKNYIKSMEKMKNNLNKNFIFKNKEIKKYKKIFLNNHLDTKNNISIKQKNKYLKIERILNKMKFIFRIYYNLFLLFAKIISKSIKIVKQIKETYQFGFNKMVQKLQNTFKKIIFEPKILANLIKIQNYQIPDFFKSFKYFLKSILNFLNDKLKYEFIRSIRKYLNLYQNISEFPPKKKYYQNYVKMEQYYFLSIINMIQFINQNWSLNQKLNYKNCFLHSKQKVFFK